MILPEKRKRAVTLIVAGLGKPKDAAMPYVQDEGEELDDKSAALDQAAAKVVSSLKSEDKDGLRMALCDFIDIHLRAAETEEMGEDEPALEG